MEWNRTKLTARSAPPANPSEWVTDETLVERVLDGDRLAFEQLVRRHQRALVNYLSRLTRMRDGAADLAQEVFIKVYVSLDAFDPKYRFTTWLYRIASNCAIDALRKKQPRTYSLTGPSSPEEKQEVAPKLAGNDPSPHDVLRLRELEGRLEQAIASLPAGYRQLILLRHRQHCRYDEIARITRLPLGTVKNRIFRAREILRSHLADVLEPGT